MASFIGVPLITILDSCVVIEEVPAPSTGSNLAKDEDCLVNGTSIIIGPNHGHELTVSKDDVSAGVEKSYIIQGSSSHRHTVIISSSHFESLKINNGVEIESSKNSNHEHLVFVSCA